MTAHFIDQILAEEADDHAHKQHKDQLRNGKLPDEVTLEDLAEVEDDCHAIRLRAHGCPSHWDESALEDWLETRI